MNEELIEKMKKYKVRQHTLAEVIGITRQTLSRKIKNGSLTQVEMDKIDKLFESLPDPEVSTDKER